jgi:hypothetical protein
LRLALSKEPNRVAVSLPSPEEGNRSSFRNAVFQYLEFRTMDKVQKPSNSKLIVLVHFMGADRLCTAWKILISDIDAAVGTERKLIF